MPSDFSSLLSDQAARVPSITTKVGTFQSRLGNQAVVNIGSETVALPFVGMYLPPPGHPVQIETRDGSVAVTGPARPLPGYGVVTTASTPRATVLAWGIPYTIPHQTSYTPVLGDDVAIIWSADGGLITGKRSVGSNVAAPAPNLGGGSTPNHPEPFTALDSGSFASSWFTNEVYASASNTGAWFYGSKIADTIPDGAVIRSAAIYLPVRAINVNTNSTLQLHSSPSRPGGAVTFVGSGFGIAPRSEWVPIPLTFIDYLKSNAGGIGMNHGGYTIYRGTQGDGLSGALDISWEA